MTTRPLSRDHPTTRPYRRLYFLHMWAEPRDDPALPPQWRCRLEDSATHEQRLFSQPGALAEFLLGLQADERRPEAAGGSAGRGTRKSNETIR